MKFFIDNNLGPDLAAGMSGFGEEVTHLQDHFKEDADDADWLPIVGQKDWFLITRDEAIRRKPAELLAYKKNKVGAFFLGGKNRNKCELIEQLVRNWRRIKEFAKKNRKPFAWKVPSRGKSFDRLEL